MQSPDKRTILTRFFPLALCLALLLPCAGCAAARTAPSAPANAPARAIEAPLRQAEPAPEPEPTPTPAPEPEAAPLALTDAQSPYRTSVLQDGDDFTFAAFAPGEAVTLTAEEPVAALYLVWTTRPAPWTLRTPAGDLPCGTQGYFHELVRLPAPAAELTLILLETDEAEVRLADVCAFTAGRLPDWVQDWQPPCERADLLLISSHADDEFIFFGGVLPTYAAERGLEVQVAYMVDHYASHPYRWHELLNGLWTAGVTRYPVTGGFPDGRFDFLWQAQAFYGEEDVLAWQVGLLRRFRPSVVVTHAETGEYNNSTHKLNAFTAEQAVASAADGAQFPGSAAAYGVWDTPKLYIHLWGEDPTVLDFEHPIEALGGATAFETAERAFDCHRSQRRSYRVYGAEYPHYDCHVYGLYRSLVGPDETKDDLFEHLAPGPAPTPVIAK